MQPIVVALSAAAGIAADSVLGRRAVNDGLLVERVAHAGCGQFREDRVEGGAGFGGQISGDRTHPVDALVADGDTPSAGPVVVGEVSVGVEAIGEFVGQLAQLVGAMLATQLGQLGLRFDARFHIDAVGQPVHEAADHRHVRGTDASVPLCCRGRGQPRPPVIAFRSPSSAAS